MAGQPLAELPHIRRLDKAVVNRIAAGEVIQRPASALKEMLENSLDAGATHIVVTCKVGGKALLQIQDNGHGIRREDLSILAERHTTSKLRAFEDLEGIATLGFRGEALASISYVAHLTVTTMTAGSVHGWRATYRDGVMEAGCPKPTAANQGTLISVEDLFWNVPLRKKALKGATEEYNQILDVMARYAVYKAGVSMSCKRQGEARSDLHTLPGASRLDNIRAVFGAAVSKHVVPFELARGSGAAGGAADELHCEVEGYISTADYEGKKTQLVLFINGRSVECTPLKRALEASYAAVLPKACKPFLFLEVRLPGSHVDVNMHPTKKEVGFLHQEDLIEAVRTAVEEKLLASCGNNSKRTFAQTLLPSAPLVEAPAAEEAPRYYRPDKLVRTDAKAQTLHAFLGASQQHQPPAPAGAAQQAEQQTQQQEQDEPAAMDEDRPAQHDSLAPPAAAAAAAAVAAAAVPAARRRAGTAAVGGAGAGAFDYMPTPMEIAGSGAATAGIAGGSQPPAASQQQQGTQFVAPVRQQRATGPSSSLASVRTLLAEAESRPHAGLKEILGGPTYVGMASPTQALVQYGTRLYLLDLQALTADMFYQQALRRFGGFRRIRLQPPLPVESLALAALEAQEAMGRWQDSDENGTKAEVAALLAELLKQKAGLLREYVGLDVDADGCLASLPQLIDQYVPDTDRLPMFVLALGQHVEWGDEESCFRGLAQALAELYRLQPSIGDAAAEAEAEAAAGGNSEEQQAARDAAQQRQRQREWTVQHVLLPALRLFLAPSRQRASDGSVVELTRLETLYRIFERC
ncbi:DNA mismatch repair Mlh1 isoform X1 [Chlorella sorokiniana]|uniref:DNA mismatch repair Mlh1 isoform X1 n=1 Tax=Chlorella sorokiniana TaxID=3076 RepID=A0A2P6TDC8_CHLSO|nr:DNA mismatch repair Mlh1 isoform X1 [Chlorella sorokiniana]|eukprot:PRW20651.1 DNA mismatch repair Mlh1 isoform X1 [Chlorella sorokiniana]